MILALAPNIDLPCCGYRLQLQWGSEIILLVPPHPRAPRPGVWEPQPLYTNIWKVSQGPSLTYLTRDEVDDLVHPLPSLEITKSDLRAHKQEIRIRSEGSQGMAGC